MNGTNSWYTTVIVILAKYHNVANNNFRLYFQSSAKFHFSTKHHWLVWSVGSYRDVEHANLNVDTELMWATQDPGQDRAYLYDLYKINYTWPLIATPAGHWDATFGLKINMTTYKYIRRENLQELLFDTAIAVGEVLVQVFPSSQFYKNIITFLVTHRRPF